MNTISTNCTLEFSALSFTTTIYEIPMRLERSSTMIRIGVGMLLHYSGLYYVPLRPCSSEQYQRAVLVETGMILALTPNVIHISNCAYITVNI
ncbi:hypothetical protein ABKN59_009323 [Abortiporus biennis]